MGRRTGEFVSPRSRPKVLSPDNLAIFVAQLVGKTSSISPHQPPHPPPYGTRETGTRANTSKKNDEQQYYFISPTMMNSNIFILPNSANQQYYLTTINITSHFQTMPTIFRLEWVNFFSGDLWWCCIYSIILKSATTPAPPPPYQQS